MKSSVEMAMEKVPAQPIEVAEPPALVRRRISEPEALAVMEEVFEPKTNRLKEGTCLIPIGDRLVVRRIPEAQFSKYGMIFIRETSRDQPNAGVVLSCGQGRITEDGKLVPLRVPVGAVVLFGKYAGSEVPLGAITDGPQLLLHEEEIMGIVANAELAARFEEKAIPPVTAAQVA